MDNKEKEITESDENKKKKLPTKAIIISLTVLSVTLLSFFIGADYITKNTPEDITIITQEITEPTVIDKGPLNINTATADELIELPAIGEKRAEDIIRYREENGDFKSKEDLMNVKGIGEGIFSNLSDLITVN